MEILRAYAKLLLSLLSSAVVALIVAIVLAAISVSGVTSMTAADVFLWIALFVFGSAMAATAVIACPSLSGGRSALLVILLAIVFGGGYVGRSGLGRWLNKKKAEQIVQENHSDRIVVPSVAVTRAPSEALPVQLIERPKGEKAPKASAALRLSSRPITGRAASTTVEAESSAETPATRPPKTTRSWTRYWLCYGTRMNSENS